MRALIGWLVVVAARLVWLVFDGEHRGLQVAGLAAAVLLGLAHVMVMPRWRYDVHRWEVAPQAVYTQPAGSTRSGASRRSPGSRPSTASAARSSSSSASSNVTVTTASAAGPLTIKGLDREAAERLVDELTTATQATRSDAT